MIVEVKTGGVNRAHTNRIIAYDGRTGLLLVNKPGPQKVPDTATVRMLIASGVLVPVAEKAPAQADTEAAGGMGDDNEQGGSGEAGTDADDNEQEQAGADADDNEQEQAGADTSLPTNTEGMTPLQALKHKALQAGYSEEKVAKLRSIKQAEALLAGEE